MTGPFRASGPIDGALLRDGIAPVEPRRPPPALEERHAARRERWAFIELQLAVRGLERTVTALAAMRPGKFAPPGAAERAGGQPVGAGVELAAGIERLRVHASGVLGKIARLRAHHLGDPLLERLRAIVRDGLMAERSTGRLRSLRDVGLTLVEEGRPLDGARETVLERVKLDPDRFGACLFAHRRAMVELLAGQGPGAAEGIAARLRRALAPYVRGPDSLLELRLARIQTRIARIDAHRAVLEAQAARYRARLEQRCRVLEQSLAALAAPQWLLAEPRAEPQTDLPAGPHLEQTQAS